MLKDYDKLNKGFVTVTSNYHTHNYLCGHAFGTVSDYVSQAVNRGYKVIGISDHFASHNDDSPLYITFDTLKTEYFPQFDEAEKQFGKATKILKSPEVPYYEGADDHYRGLRNELDYLVMGQHGYMLNGVRKNTFWDGVDEQNVIAYCRHCVKAIKTGFFTVFAHPDLIFYKRHPVTPAIAAEFDNMIKTAVGCGMITELNSNGIRNAQFKYPTDLLVDACIKYNARVVVSADCHIPSELGDGHVTELYAYAKARGLNVIDEI